MDIKQIISAQNSNKKSQRTVQQVISAIPKERLPLIPQGKGLAKRITPDDIKDIDISFERGRRIVDFFPVTRRKLITRMPLTVFSLECFRGVVETWIEKLNLFSLNLSSRIRERLNVKVTSGIEALKVCVLRNAEDRYAAFLGQYVSQVIKRAHSDMRRELLTKLNRNAEEIFYKHLLREVAALSDKVREDQILQQLGPANLSVVSGADSLPRGTRFVFGKKNTTCYVIEDDSQVRTVSFRSEDSDGHTEWKKRCSLAFPFIVFILALHRGRFHSLFAFFRNERISSITDPLFEPVLSNLSASNLVCFPKPSSTSTPYGIAEEAFLNFWGSTFNVHHWGSRFRDRGRFAELATLDDWERNTKKNPRFILSLNWNSAFKSVEQAVAYAVSCIESDKGYTKESINISTPLETYLKECALKFANSIQEKSFFLVAHDSIDDPSVAIAEQKIKELCDQNAAQFKENVEVFFRDIFSDKEIHALTDRELLLLTEELKKNIEPQEIASALVRKALDVRVLTQRKNVFPK